MFLVVNTLQINASYTTVDVMSYSKALFVLVITVIQMRIHLKLSVFYTYDLDCQTKV